MRSCRASSTTSRLPSASPTASGASCCSIGASRISMACTRPRSSDVASTKCGRTATAPTPRLAIISASSRPPSRSSDARTTMAAAATPRVGLRTSLRSRPRTARSAMSCARPSKCRSSPRPTARWRITAPSSWRPSARRRSPPGIRLPKGAQRRARLAYWLWEPEARRYVLAAEAAEILGLPVEDMATNDQFLPYVHEDDRAWVAEAYLGQTERLEPCVIEYRWRRPGGEVIWLRDMCEQERDAAGRVRRL